MAAIPSDPAQLAALIKSQNLATLLATMTGNGGLAAGKTVEAVGYGADRRLALRDAYRAAVEVGLVFVPEMLQGG